MKKTLLVIICLLVLFPLSIGQSAERGEVDGYKWSEWGKSWDAGYAWKIGFVTGWGQADQVMRIGIPFLLKFKIHKNTLEGFSKEFGLEISNVTFGQIVDMIDRIYSDPRVKSWEICEIMPLVRGRLKGGWTERDLDEVIAYQIKKKEHYRNKSETEKWYKEDLELALKEPEVLKTLKAYRFE